MLKQIWNNEIIQIFVIFLISATLISLTQEANGSYGIIIKGGKIVIYITTIFSTICYAVILGRWDAKVIITNHWPRVIYRFILLSFIPGILYLQGASITVFYLAFVSYTIFWYGFEIEYDIARDLNPYYIGNTAISDKVIQWLNKNLLGRLYPFWYIGLKLSLTILSFYLAVKYYL